MKLKIYNLLFHFSSLSCIKYIFSHNYILKYHYFCVLSAACGLSEKDIADIEHHQPCYKDLTTTEKHAAEKHPEKYQNISVSDLPVEPCGTDTHASSLQHENSTLLLTNNRTCVEKAQFCNKSKQSGLGRSQQNRWIESKETYNDKQSPSTERKADLNAEPLYGRRKPNKQKLSCSDSPEDPQEMTWMTSTSSLQKVNDWFSRSDDVLISDDFHDAGSNSNTKAETEEIPSAADGFFVSSEKEDLMASDQCDALMYESRRVLSKPVESNIEDKIFGKTYRRKASFPNLNCTTEDVTLESSPLEPHMAHKHPFTNKLKRKRRITSSLGPEDFIKKVDLAIVQKSPEKKIEMLNQMDQNGQVVNTTMKGLEIETRGDDTQKEKIANSTASSEKQSASRHKAEPVSNSISNMELELNIPDFSTSKTPKKKRLRRKSSTRHIHALELVASRNLSPHNHTEHQIDSCSSSEEIKDKEVEQMPVRHSKKLQVEHKELANGTINSNKPNEQTNKRCARSIFSELNLVNDCARANKFREFVNSSIQKEAEKNIGTIQESNHPKELRLSKGKGLEMETSIQNTCVTLVSETDYESQSSNSLLDTNTPGKAKKSPNQLIENPKKLTHDCTKDYRKDIVGFKGQLGYEVNPSQETCIDESDLDTQYLQNTFKSSKRQSFSLLPSSRNTEKECSTVFESLRKQSKKTTVNSEQKEENHKLEETKMKHLPSIHATNNFPEGCQKGSPVDYAKCNIKGISEFCPSQVRGNENELIANLNLKNSCHVSPLSPNKSSVKSPSEKNSPEGKFKEHSLSPEKAPGNGSVAQNTVSKMSSKNNSREDAFKEVSSGTSNEVGSSNNEVGSSDENMKAEFGQNRGHKLSAILKSVLRQPEVYKQSNCTQLEIKKQGENEAVQNKTDFSPRLMLDNPEQLMETSNASQICSETPDDLLNDDEIKEISFAESDIRERSAVFNKSVQKIEFERRLGSLDDACLAPVHLRGSGKLESLEDDMTSEDEELSCVQKLLFGSEASILSQSTRNSAGATENSSKKIEKNLQSLKNSLSDGSNQILAKTSQKYHRSEESKFSMSLFSSQHSALEDVTANTKTPDRSLMLNHPSKRRYHTENQEVLNDQFTSDDEMETNLKEDKQEEQIMDSCLGIETIFLCFSKFIL